MVNYMKLEYFGDGHSIIYHIILLSYGVSSGDFIVDFPFLSLLVTV